MKQQFIKLVAVLSIIAPVDAEEPEAVRKVLNDPNFTEEFCSRQSPDESLPFVLIDRSVNGSLAGIDRFYEAYAIRLSAVTDRKFPAAKVLRPAILKSFQQVHLAIVRAYGGSGAHDYERLEGRIEWIIYNGYNRQFDGSISDYGDEQIRRAIDLFAEGYKPSVDVRKEMAETVKAGLGELSILTPLQARYFRAELMHFIGSYYASR